MLDHPMGATSERDFRLDFDPWVRLEFHGSKISSDGGLLLFRGLDETLGLHDLVGRSLRDTRTGKNGVHGKKVARSFSRILRWFCARLLGSQCIRCMLQAPSKVPRTTPEEVRCQTRSLFRRRGSAHILCLETHCKRSGRAC